MKIDYRLSNKISLFGSFSMLLVVMMHCVNFSENHGVSYFFQDFIFHGFTRIAVPYFFMIAGFLFYKDIQSYDRNLFLTKIKVRAKTVFIPFILWSLITFLLFYLMQIPSLSKSFFNNRLIEDYTFWDILSIGLSFIQ